MDGFRDKQLDELIKGWMDSWIDGQMDGQMEGQMDTDSWIYGQINLRRDRWMDDVQQDRQTYGQIDCWMGRQMNR